MAVMRRGASWSFVVWVPDDERAGGRCGGAGTARSGSALSAERRFLGRARGRCRRRRLEPAGPTVGEFLVEWLVSSEPTRRPTTSVSYERCVRDHVIPYLGEVRLRSCARSTSGRGRRRCCVRPGGSVRSAVDRRRSATAIGCCVARCRTRCGGN